MKNVPDNLGNAATEDRFAGQTNYRGTGRREIGGLPSEPVEPEAPRNGASVSSMLDRPLPAQPSMSLTEVTALTEPVFSTTGSWLDIDAGGGTPVADHPLLRGLLMELPAKGSAMPSREWLDRWFEVARSILELLYMQDRIPGPKPRR